MVLHLVNKSPYQNLALQDCLALAQDDDAVLLLEDGVYAVLQAAPGNLPLLDRARQGLRLYAVESDLASRGLLNQAPVEVVPVSYSQWVDLTVEYHRIQSWY